MKKYFEQEILAPAKKICEAAGIDQPVYTGSIARHDPETFYQIVGKNHDDYPMEETMDAYDNMREQEVNEELLKN